MNYTSISQSKKLLKLGLSPESADMFYEYVDEDHWRNIPECAPIMDGDLPCWSVGALLEMMPIIKAEDGKNANPFIAKTPEGEYYVVYATLHKEVLASKMCDTSIEAAVDILIYLLEHNYIKQ